LFGHDINRIQNCDRGYVNLSLKIVSIPVHGNRHLPIGTLKDAGLTEENIG